VQGGISARVQSSAISGLLLLAWAALCFWAGFGFASVAAILLLVAIVPLTLIAGHRFVDRRYVIVEVVAVVAAVVVAVIAGFSTPSVVVLGAVIGVDILACSALILRRGRGVIRRATRNLLVIIAALGVATGAAVVVSALASVPSCGTASVGAGGATTSGSANAGECFAVNAANCQPHSLTVQETGTDELATHRYRIVSDANGQCHFTDSVTFGPPSDPMQHAATYTCPALTAQIGAPGEQQVQLTQCSGGVASGVAAPVIPTNAFQPFVAPTPTPTPA
jgi:hypothetical protein